MIKLEQLLGGIIMVKEIIKESEDKMKKVIEITKKDFMSIRTGKASPSLLEKITVDYYGTPTAVNQLANISVPEPRLIVVQPWDKGSLAGIEKAIMKSDLGITPTNDGSVIRLAIPPLTQERRKELAKNIKKEGEEKKVAVRNIRRDANEHLKKMEKDGDISADENKKAQEEIQKLTDKYTKEVDQVVANKEKEIMEV